MSMDWGHVAKEYWDKVPHPAAPGLTIGEFATAVKLATLVKFGGHADGKEAELFWGEFKGLGMTPSDFEHTVERLAPISYTYHGRPPTMQEIVKLQAEPPAKAHSYFADLPDKHYPFVSAATMVKNLTAADPYSKQHLGRPPVKLEAAYLANSGENPADYYARLAQPPPPTSNIQSGTNGVQTPVGRDDRGRGSENSWRSPTG